MTQLDALAQRQLTAALQQLSQRRADEALALVQDVVARHPQSVDAQHLLALCHKHLGNFQAAEAAFREAQRLAPLDATIAGNLANLYSLQRNRAQAIDAYLRAIELNPHSAELFLNLGLALLDEGQLSQAFDAFTAGLKLKDSSAALWQGLGAVCREMGELDQAGAALERAVKLEPQNGATWTALGVIARLRGNPNFALECYEQARSTGYESLELLDAEASALFDLGQTTESLTKVASLIARKPTYVAGQMMRTEILYESGVGEEESLAGFAAAVNSHPEESALRKAYASALYAAGLFEETLAQVDVLCANTAEPDSLSLAANTFVKLGRYDEALQRLSQAPKDCLADARFTETLARVLLCKGDPGRAAQVLGQALQTRPFDQALLVLLGVAWRLTDESRESWLCDYDRFVMRIALREEFLVDLERDLRALHRMRREPLKQSLRFGTQTSGNLFGRDIASLHEAQAAIATGLKAYLETLPTDPHHPFLARRREAMRFAGSWSVLLRSGGHHVSHFHQEGWISSAYYVSLPQVMIGPHSGGADEDLGGCLQFGQPPTELGLDLAPRKLIRPQRGELVLFPSYFWHGTLPFTGEDTRLTMAFDVVPAS